MNPDQRTPEELERLVHRELSALPPRKAPAGFAARFEARLAAEQARASLASEQLEQLVHRELRALPPRSAPRTLESRVLAEIARRAALPWWQQDFAHWPMAARAAFVVSSAALIAAILWLLPNFGRSELDQALAPQLATFDSLRAIASRVAEFGGLVVRSISPVWIYGGLAALAALYAVLFGLGTAAYRTLYASR
jgi:hypothetical protein